MMTMAFALVEVVVTNMCTECPSVTFHLRVGYTIVVEYEVCTCRVLLSTESLFQELLP